MPGFAVRTDVLSALLGGRLGLELEVQLYQFITFEMVPEFIVWQRPPLLNLGRGSNLTQHSTGIGALSGSSFGLGFWFNGKPFEGYFLKALFSTNGYRYESDDDQGFIDSVNHTERWLYVQLGSYSRWGPFVLGGAIGIGVELNRDERCFDNTTGKVLTSNCDGELDVKVNRQGDYVNVHPWTYPIVLTFRVLSLGFVFD